MVFPRETERGVEIMRAPPQLPPPPAIIPAADVRLERLRVKLMDHLRQAASRIELPPATAAATSPENLPWTLRTRAPRHANPPEPAAPSRRRRARFSVQLSKEEIDEDLYAFTGRRNPRRPKKRPRSLQKQLDIIFPGLWLSEVTAETYLAAPP